jgi:alkylated DNA repair dioxygenase AlkB
MDFITEFESKENNSSLLKTKFKFEPNEIEQINNLPLSKHKVVLYGKTFETPREVGFFSNDSNGYAYSGNIARSISLDSYPFLSQILNRVNQLTDSNFNGILVNKYNDGSDYIGPHSDDERRLGRNGVVSISIGTERTFRIRNKSNKEFVIDVKVSDGDMYWMKGDFQKHYTHEIPKQKKVKNQRISLTFRRHLNKQK